MTTLAEQQTRCNRRVPLSLTSLRRYCAGAAYVVYIELFSKMFGPTVGSPITIEAIRFLTRAGEHLVVWVEPEGPRRAFPRFPRLSRCAPQAGRALRRRPAR